MTDLEQSVMEIIRRYSSAVYERDVEAFIGLYDSNVRIYDAWDTWEYDDTAHWQRSIEAWLTSHVTEKLKVTFDDVQNYGSVAFAVVSAIVTYVRVSAEGEQLGAIQNRITWSLRAIGQLLRIFHEHTSVPVNFQNMKPFLSRKPAS